MAPAEDVFLLGKSREEARKRFWLWLDPAASIPVVLAFVLGMGLMWWAGYGKVYQVIGAGALAAAIVWLLFASGRGTPKRDRVWKMELLPDAVSLHFAWGTERVLPYEDIVDVSAVYGDVYGGYDKLALCVSTRGGEVIHFGQCGSRGEAVDGAAEALRGRVFARTGTRAGSAEADRAARLWQKRVTMAFVMPAVAFATLFILAMLWLVASKIALDWRLRREGVTVEALVTGVTRHHKRDGQRIRYELLDGTGTAHLGGGRVSGDETHKEGDRILVRYLPDDPGISRIEGQLPLVSWWEYSVAALLCLLLLPHICYLALMFCGRSLAEVRGRFVLLRWGELEDDYARGKMRF